eukprot:m.18831 g.18831  ORF g.18831 m.18831 type:complete len:356 (-) comp6408_c0_seq1:464-1531(-)
MLHSVIFHGKWKLPIVGTITSPCTLLLGEFNGSSLGCRVRGVGSSLFATLLAGFFCLLCLLQLGLDLFRGGIYFPLFPMHIARDKSVNWSSLHAHLGPCTLLKLNNNSSSFTDNGTNMTLWNLDPGTNFSFLKNWLDIPSLQNCKHFCLAFGNLFCSTANFEARVHLVYSGSRLRRNSLNLFASATNNGSNFFGIIHRNFCNNTVSLQNTFHVLSSTEGLSQVSCNCQSAILFVYSDITIGISFNFLFDLSFVSEEKSSHAIWTKWVCLVLDLNGCLRIFFFFDDLLRSCNVFSFSFNHDVIRLFLRNIKTNSRSCLEGLDLRTSLSNECWALSEGQRISLLYEIFEDGSHLSLG